MATTSSKPIKLKRQLHEHHSLKIDDIGDNIHVARKPKITISKPPDHHPLPPKRNPSLKEAEKVPAKVKQRPAGTDSKRGSSPNEKQNATESRSTSAHLKLDSQLPDFSSPRPATPSPKRRDFSGITCPHSPSSDPDRPTSACSDEIQKRMIEGCKQLPECPGKDIIVHASVDAMDRKQVYKDHSDNLRAQVEAERSNYDSLACNYAKERHRLENDLWRYKNDKEDSEVENRRLMREKHGLANKLNDLEAQVVRCCDELEEARKEIKIHEEKYKRLETVKQNTLNRKEGEIALLRSANKSLTVTINSNNASLLELKTAWTEEKERLLADRKSLEGKCQIFERSSLDFFTEKKSLGDTVQSLNGNIETLNNRILDLEKRQEPLVAETQTLSQSAKVLQDENSRLNQEIENDKASAAEVIEALNTRVKGQQGRILDLACRLAASEEARKKLDNENQSLREDEQKLNAALADKHSLTDELRTLKGEKSVLEKNIARRDAEYRAQAAEVQALKDNNSSLNGANSHLSARLGASDTANSNLQTTNQQLSDKLAAAEKTLNENKNELGALQKDKNAVTKADSAIRLEFEQLLIKEKAKTRQIQALERTLADLNAKDDQALAEQKALVVKLNQQVSGANQARMTQVERLQAEIKILKEQQKHSGSAQVQELARIRRDNDVHQRALRAALSRRRRESRDNIQAQHVLAADNEAELQYVFASIRDLEKQSAVRNSRYVTETQMQLKALVRDRDQGLSYQHSLQSQLRAFQEEKQKGFAIRQTTIDDLEGRLATVEKALQLARDETGILRYVCSFYHLIDTPRVEAAIDGFGIPRESSYRHITDPSKRCSGYRDVAKLVGKEGWDTIRELYGGIPNTRFAIRIDDCDLDREMTDMSYASVLNGIKVEDTQASKMAPKIENTCHKEHQTTGGAIEQPSSQCIMPITSPTPGLKDGGVMPPPPAGNTTSESERMGESLPNLQVDTDLSKAKKVSFVPIPARLADKTRRETAINSPHNSALGDHIPSKRPRPESYDACMHVPRKARYFHSNKEERRDRHYSPAVCDQDHRPRRDERREQFRRRTDRYYDSYEPRRDQGPNYRREGW